jgi:hypothetical protein
VYIIICRFGYLFFTSAVFIIQAYRALIIGTKFSHLQHPIAAQSGRGDFATGPNKIVQI